MTERLPRIVDAYLAASLASGFALALGLLLMAFAGLLQEARWHDAGISAGHALFYLLLLGFLASAFVVILAFVPALAVIAVAEAARLRAAAFYAGAGGIGAIVCWAVFVREGGLLKMPGLALTLTPDRALRTGALALVAGMAGLVGGLVYWSIAGKTAGAWRAPQRAQP